MSPHEMSDTIASAVRASLLQVVSSGQPLSEALALGVDRAIANNAAQAIAMASELE